MQNERKQFIIDETRGGVLVKRYYTVVRNSDGRLQRKFTHSERVNPVAASKYRLKNAILPQDKKKRKSRKKVVSRFAVGTTALLAVVALMLPVAMKVDNNIIERDVSYSYSQQAEKHNNRQEQLTPEQIKNMKAPEIKTYTSSNGSDYFYYDTAIAVARYNYLQVMLELKEYNSKVSEDDKYHFDPSLFSPAMFVGAQIKESSLEVTKTADGVHFGAFKISQGALDDANKVSNNLYGASVVNNVEDLTNVIAGSRACMYYYIQNYEYLHDFIEEKGLNMKVTKEMVIDCYLYGIGNIENEILSGGYTQKSYSKMIMDYEKVIQPYYEELYYDGLINKEHLDRTKEMRNELYKIVDKYSNNTSNSDNIEAQG